jgi:hypothetical protein
MWPSPRNPKPGEPRDFYAEADEDSWLNPFGMAERIFSSTSRTYQEPWHSAVAGMCMSVSTI